jgi:hypothetical protein
VSRVYPKIIVSTCAIALGLCFLAPSFLRLAHMLHEHSDSICQLEGSVHIHKTKVACEFQKIKLTANYYQPLKSVAIFNNAVVKARPFPFLQHVKPSFESYFSLRAPPYIS